MSASPRKMLLLLAMLAAAPGAQAADISGAMTADFLVQCQSSQTACRDFASDMLKALSAAPTLASGKPYRGCAPLPLSLPQTGQLLERILSRPQDATGNAAQDIASAAESVWPCR